MFAGETAAVPSYAGSAALTVAGARQLWAARFVAAGVDAPELAARILVGHALGLDHAALIAAGPRRLEATDEHAIAALAYRRLVGEPVARIVGRKEFWSLDFHLNEATLVPRPETETVVEAALAAVEANGTRRRPLRIVDLGTGCGAILLALLTELPQAVGIGIDINQAAIRCARDNARRLGFIRAGFLCGDMAAALRGPFDLVVSNPPYIASGEIAGLAPEVRLFDPLLALDGGPDGLKFYRSIAAAALPLLADGGSLVVEVGCGQDRSVAALFAAAGLAPAPPRADLMGDIRVVVARKAA